MARDEHGLPVPGEASPLPWSANEERDEQVNERRIDDHDGVRVAGVWDDDDNRFMVHSANWIIPCREIVRRLSVWYDESGKPGGSVSFNVIEVSRDAAKLWADMQRDAKRGDDVH